MGELKVCLNFHADDDDDDADDSDVAGSALTGAKQRFTSGPQGVHGGQWNVRLYSREQWRLTARRAPSARYK